MHFHLPKPLHGWRAFWGEVGIIVFGVLIALGAQQLVEDRGERERFRSSIKALRDDAARQDWSAAEFEVVRPCIMAQIDAIEARLTSADRAPVPSFHEAEYRDDYVIRIPDRVLSTSVWQSVSSSDLLRRLDPKLDARLASHYELVARNRTLTDSSLDIVHQLRTLAVMMPSSEAERMRYFDLLERLRGNVILMDTNAGQTHDLLTGVGFAAKPASYRMLPSYSGTFIFCKAHDLTLGKLRPAIVGNAD